MKKKGKIITTIISTILIVVAIMAGALQVGKAEDTAGKITISKKAVATSDRKAKVTLEIHTSELKQSTADIIFVMDHSSSMNYDVCTKYETRTWVDRWGREHTEKVCTEEDTRLEVAKDAAIGLVDELIPTSGTGNVRIGFVSFGTYYESDNSIALTKDKAAVKAKINSLKEKSNNGTNVHAGLKAAQNQLTSSTAETKIIILLSDGEPTYFIGKNNTLCGNGQNDRVDTDSSCKVVQESDNQNKPSDVAEETATVLKSSPINAEIYAIGFGDSANDIASFLTNQIATKATEEKTYAHSATDTEELEKAFAKIASDIKNTLATDATVTDIVPESFKLTAEAKEALLATYGDDITLIENEDGTTTIKVHYDEISSVQGTYTIEYEVIADENHYGAMYTNVKATFEATATEDNTYYQDKDIKMTFDQPVVAISRVTKDNDYTNVDKYIVKEGKSITIELDDNILNNDSIYVHTDKPTNALGYSNVVDEIIIAKQPTNGNLTVNNDGTFTYEATEGSAGENGNIITFDYYVVSTVTIDGQNYTVTSNTSTVSIKVVKSETTYTVKYLDKTTNKEIADTKTVNNKYVYETVKEQAITVTGYNLAEGEESEKELKLTENATENVIIFYYTIKPAKVEDPTVTKQGPDTIVSAEEAVDYVITYKTTITDYKGTATITIVDELPYEIDEEKSNIAGGTYNKENKTITWTILVENIDTYTNGTKDISIVKNISVYYNYPEFTGKEVNVSNKVNTNISVETAPDKDKEITEDTPVNITGKLVVEHLYVDEEGKEHELVPTQPATEEKVGTEYTTSPVKVDGYKVSKTPSNATGKYVEGTTTVKYYYERVEAEITDTEINKTAETEEITSSKDEVTYNVTYKTTIKEYNGPVTITIVDTLPYAIDESKSNLNSGEYEGIYNETNKTITWVIKKDVNTYANKPEGESTSAETISISLKYTVVYKDLDASVEKITNKVDSTISVETTDPKDASDTEDVPVNINGKVITHHIDKSGNTLSSDVETEDKVGKEYTTTDVEIPGYKLTETPDNKDGKYIEGIIEVTYVYERLGATAKDPVTTKTGTTEITNSNDKNKYTITYDAIVENYKGNITVTIVDELPYEIDEEKSNIAGGTYNKEEKTITWTENYVSEDATKDLVIDITKVIEVYYKNIDATKESYTNKVKVTLSDDIEETEDNETKAEHTTEVNIKGKVTTYYYLEGTTTELANKKETTGKVGAEYTTEAKDIEGYNIVNKTPENHKGNYTEKDIVVIYEYTRKIADINEENITKKSVLEEITSKNTIVDYQIVYTAKIVDYKGTAIVTIVDYLPYEIDLSESDINNGVYNASTKTITWTETIEGINTFANGEYSVNITKNINVKYINIASDKEVVNKVTGSVDTDTKDSNGKEAEEEIIASIKGDLIVKHIYKDKDGNEKVLKIEDTKTDYVGYAYTTEAKNFDGYTLSVIPENANGEYKEEDTIVIYYYDRTPAEVEKNIVNKVSTNNIVTNIKDAFNYTINYQTTLKEYEGKATITIVDYLPYAIDLEKSNIADGIYNKDTLTITWVKEIDVNTYKNINNDIEIEIEISLYYENLESDTRVVTNKVNSKLELETTDPVESTDKTDTNLEVKGNVIVNYVDEFGNKLTDTINLTDLVGNEYKTEELEFEGYIFSKVEGKTEGKYIDGTIEVTYYYEKEGTGNVMPEPPQTNVDNTSYYISLITSGLLLSLITFRKKILN